MEGDMEHMRAMVRESNKWLKEKNIEEGREKEKGQKKLDKWIAEGKPSIDGGSQEWDANGRIKNKVNREIVLKKYGR